jgi:hypothetical protein
MVSQKYNFKPYQSSCLEVLNCRQFQKLKTGRQNRIGFMVQPIIAIAIPVLIFGTIGYLINKAQNHRKKKTEYVNPRNIEIGEPDTIRFNDSVYIFSKKLDTVFLNRKSR